MMTKFLGDLTGEICAFFLTVLSAGVVWLFRLEKRVSRLEDDRKDQADFNTRLESKVDQILLHLMGRQ